MNCRAHLVKWITENHRPTSIVKDRELCEILMAGRPSLEIPSPNTIPRDIKVSFDKCWDRVASLFQVCRSNVLRSLLIYIIEQKHPECLHFATDAWTSPNHRAFIAWTVHFEYEGVMMSFLLDIIEVPESHSGATLANVFQAMLERFGLEKKVSLMSMMFFCN
jgi:hypothetical protein